MIRIAICDDEEAVCSALENDINKACAEIHIESEIDIFSSGAILKNHLKNGSVYNIFFLDIELQDDTGIAVSDCIRNEVRDESAQIVYVSGKTEYDRQLFAFRPFAFIEKPFNTSMIRTTLEKYMRIYGDKNDLFHYKYGHDTFWVNLSTVLYFKSNRKLISIITLTNRDEFYGTMSSIAPQLSPNGFISPHKSYLVNYRFIKVFQADAIIMVNGDIIPIAKGKRDEMSRLQLHYENGGH
jgi:two component transcriptional regulator, lytTR family